MMQRHVGGGGELVMQRHGRGGGDAQAWQR